MKKYLSIVLVLLLVLSTSLVTALPVMACSLGSLLTMSASASEVSPGGIVTLYIAEQNTGDAAEAFLADVYIELSYGSTTINLNNTSPSFVASSDPDSDGFLDYLETWRWEVTLTVNAPTTFTAIGHGFNWSDDIPTDITYPDYPERSQVTITIVPGDEGCTPGFWKVNYDNKEAKAWGIYAPETPLKFSDIFGLPETYALQIRGNGRATITDPTLRQALDANGGGLNLLVRSAVAALLNAANPDIDYPRTETDIIVDVREAIFSGDYSLGSELDYDNNLGCPIDQQWFLID